MLQPSNPKILPAALAAGVLSALLFLGIAAAGLGFFFIFLPTLPLLYAGLSRSPRIALLGMLIAALGIGIVGGAALSTVYIILLGFPAWHIARQAILWRRAGSSEEREWFPIGRIMAELTLYACAIVVLMTLYYADQQAGLPGIVSEHIRTTFADLRDQYREVIDMMADRWSFLVFSITIWLWALVLYAHAWMANRILVKQEKAVRPDMAVRPFAMPSTILFLLAICGLASLIGSPNMQFLGKAVLIALLLPYFFLGVGVMHEGTKNWPNRRFFLFFVYFTVFAQFWPALMLSGVGLWQHIKTLNKHLSSGGSSSSN